MSNPVISFFEKVGSFFKNLFKKAPTYEQVIMAVLPIVAPLLQTVVSLADPAIAPIVEAVIAKVEASLATVGTVLQEGTAAPGSSTAVTVETALNSVNSNLKGLLADANIKNSTKAAEIETAVNSITTEIDAMLANLPAAVTPAAPAAS